MRELGEGSAGIWRRADALRAVTRGVERSQRYDGNWLSPYPGVLTDAGVPMSPERWAFAAVLASGGVLLEDQPTDVSALGAVGCSRDAARVYGLPLVDDDDPATGAQDHLHHDVAVWTHARPTLRARPPLPTDPVHVLHRRQLALGPDDVVRLESGLWLTTCVRTLFDLTAVVTGEALVCALDAALHEELVARDELDEYVDSHRGWRSTPSFGAAVELSDGRAESPHETLTRLLLKPHWPELEPQVELLSGAGELVARFDHADEELRMAVESDGRRFHDAARDKVRDRRTESYRWWTERVSWWEVRCRRDQTRRRVLAARDRRRRLLAA